MEKNINKTEKLKKIYLEHLFLEKKKITEISDLKNNKGLTIKNNRNLKNLKKISLKAKYPMLLTYLLVKLKQRKMKNDHYSYHFTENYSINTRKSNFKYIFKRKNRAKLHRNFFRKHLSKIFKRKLNKKVLFNASIFNDFNKYIKTKYLRDYQNKRKIVEPSKIRFKSLRLSQFFDLKSFFQDFNKKGERISRFSNLPKNKRYFFYNIKKSPEILRTFIKFQQKFDLRFSQFKHEFLNVKPKVEKQSTITFFNLKKKVKTSTKLAFFEKAKIFLKKKKSLIKKSLIETFKKAQAYKLLLKYSKITQEVYPSTKIRKKMIILKEMDKYFNDFLSSYKKSSKISNKKNIFEIIYYELAHQFECYKSSMAHQDISTFRIYHNKLDLLLTQIKNLKIYFSEKLGFDIKSLKTNNLYLNLKTYLVSKINKINICLSNLFLDKNLIEKNFASQQERFAWMFETIYSNYEQVFCYKKTVSRFSLKTKRQENLQKLKPSNYSLVVKEKEKKKYRRGKYLFRRSIKDFLKLNFGLDFNNLSPKHAAFFRKLKKILKFNKVKNTLKKRFSNKKEFSNKKKFLNKKNFLNKKEFLNKKIIKIKKIKPKKKSNFMNKFHGKLKSKVNTNSLENFFKFKRPSRKEMEEYERAPVLLKRKLVLAKPEIFLTKLIRFFDINLSLRNDHENELLNTKHKKKKKKKSLRKKKFLLKKIKKLNFVKVEVFKLNKFFKQIIGKTKDFARSFDITLNLTKVMQKRNQLVKKYFYNKFYDYNYLNSYQFKKFNNKVLGKIKLNSLKYSKYTCGMFKQTNSPQKYLNHRLKNLTFLRISKLKFLKTKGLNVLNTKYLKFNILKENSISRMDEILVKLANFFHKNHFTFDFNILDKHNFLEITNLLKQVELDHAIKELMKKTKVSFFHHDFLNKAEVQVKNPGYFTQDDDANYFIRQKNNLYLQKLKLLNFNFRKDKLFNLQKDYVVFSKDFSYKNIISELRYSKKNLLIVEYFSLLEKHLAVDFSKFDKTFEERFFLARFVFDIIENNSNKTNKSLGNLDLFFNGITFKNNLKIIYFSILIINLFLVCNSILSFKKEFFLFLKLKYFNILKKLLDKQKNFFFKIYNLFLRNDSEDFLKKMKKKLFKNYSILRKKDQIFENTKNLKMIFFSKKKKMQKYFLFFKNLINYNFCLENKSNILKKIRILSRANDKKINLVNLVLTKLKSLKQKLNAKFNLYPVYNKKNNDLLSYCILLFLEFSVNCSEDKKDNEVDFANYKILKLNQNASKNPKLILDYFFSKKNKILSFPTSIFSKISYKNKDTKASFKFLTNVSKNLKKTFATKIMTFFSSFLKKKNYFTNKNKNKNRNKFNPILNLQKNRFTYLTEKLKELDFVNFSLNHCVNDNDLLPNLKKSFSFHSKKVKDLFELKQTRKNTNVKQPKVSKRQAKKLSKKNKLEKRKIDFGRTSRDHPKNFGTQSIADYEKLALCREISKPKVSHKNLKNKKLLLLSRKKLVNFELFERLKKKNLKNSLRVFGMPNLNLNAFRANLIKLKDKVLALKKTRVKSKKTKFRQNTAKYGIDPSKLGEFKARKYNYVRQFRELLKFFRNKVHFFWNKLLKKKYLSVYKKFRWLKLKKRSRKIFFGLRHTFSAISKKGLSRFTKFAYKDKLRFLGDKLMTTIFKYKPENKKKVNLNNLGNSGNSGNTQKIVKKPIESKRKANSKLPNNFRVYNNLMAKKRLIKNNYFYRDSVFIKNNCFQVNAIKFVRNRPIKQIYSLITNAMLRWHYEQKALEKKRFVLKKLKAPKDGDKKFFVSKSFRKKGNNLIDFLKIALNERTKKLRKKYNRYVYHAKKKFFKRFKPFRKTKTMQKLNFFKQRLINFALKFKLKLSKLINIKKRKPGVKFKIKNVKKINDKQIKKMVVKKANASPKQLLIKKKNLKKTKHLKKTNILKKKKHLNKLKKIKRLGKSNKLKQSKRFSKYTKLRKKKKKRYNLFLMSKNFVCSVFSTKIKQLQIKVKTPRQIKKNFVLRKLWKKRNSLKMVYYERFGLKKEKRKTCKLVNNLKKQKKWKKVVPEFKNVLGSVKKEILFVNFSKIQNIKKFIFFNKFLDIYKTIKNKSFFKIYEAT